MSAHMLEYSFATRRKLVLMDDPARQLCDERAVVLIERRCVGSLVECVGSAFIAGCHQFPAAVEFIHERCDLQHRRRHRQDSIT